jgi:hypothetical protein
MMNTRHYTLVISINQLLFPTTDATAVLLVSRLIFTDTVYYISILCLLGMLCRLHTYTNSFDSSSIQIFILKW